MMSPTFVRLMFLRQTGHCDRLGSPGPARFSPAMSASMRQVWQKRWPQAVAVKSVGVSMQMTQVKFLNVVGGSSGFVCALTASLRCFWSTSCTDGSSSVKSTLSTFSVSRSGRSLYDPSAHLCRFADGPASGVSWLLLRLGGALSGNGIKSTYSESDRRGWRRMLLSSWERLAGGMTGGGSLKEDES